MHLHVDSKTAGFNTTATIVASMTRAYNVDQVVLSVKNNDGSTAVSDAVLSFQAHPDAGWVVVKNSGWATADPILVYGSVDIDTLAAGVEGLVIFNTFGCYAWKLTMRTAANTITATAWWSAKGYQITQGSF